MIRMICWDCVSTNHDPLILSTLQVALSASSCETSEGAANVESQIFVAAIVRIDLCESGDSDQARNQHKTRTLLLLNFVMMNVFAMLVDLIFSKLSPSR